MRISFLIIGSEVLEGKVVEQNTHTLAHFLRDHHLELSRTMMVRDHQPEIHQALEFLYAHSELVITSGGLGPTADDITKEAIATYLQRPVSFSPAALTIAEENYQRFEKVFPGREHGYAWLPEGFVALANSTGYAPGLFGEVAGKLILSAPGVPREFRSMLEDHLLKLISHKLSRTEQLESVTIRTWRVPEEKIFGELDRELWGKLEQWGAVSSLPVLAGVDIVVKLRDKSFEELEAKRQQVLAIIEASPIKQYVWHYGSESLEEVIVARAREKKISLAIAESATGGLCSHRLTNVPGVSTVFPGSIISYAEAVKERELGVSRKTLSTKGVVSPETAEEMAQGIAGRMKVDLAASITGVAGPGGGSPQAPVGTAYIGVCLRGRIKSRKVQFSGDREQIKNRFAQALLMTLLEEMANIA
jgi:nicotinamide-nucleotide amidase